MRNLYRLSTTIAISAIVVSLFACATTGRGTSFKPSKGPDQLQAFRSGVTYVSSPKPNSFITVSITGEKIDGDRPPTIVVSVINTGSEPFDLQLADFSLSSSGITEVFSTRQEVIDAINSDKAWRTALLILAGGIDSARANVAANNTTFSGSAATEYRSSDGRTIGYGQSNFRGSVSDPIAGQAAANTATDRSAADIARIRAASGSEQAKAEALVLERETVFPKKGVTFVLVPKLAKTTESKEVLHILTARVGGDVHTFTLVERRGQ